MFSAAIELILNVAYREATVRRHTHLTLEHLLYVLAHDPEGEKILTACGADLPALRHALDTFLDGLEQSKKGRQREPQQTLAFQRVLQTAVLHVQSAGKDEVRFGDVLAAILQQPNSYAAELLQSQDVTRLDVLNYISHGITKKPAGPAAGPGREPAPAGKTGDGPAPARDPLAAFAVNLTERATQGRLDPLIGRRDELRRTLQILCRRRKNNPVFVGDAGVGKTALAEGLAARLLEDDVPERLRGAEIFALDTAALLAGTRFRGDFEERFKAVVDALAGRPMPILFIDEVHATVGAGATTGGTMDLAMLIKPLLAAGDLRLIGSTTFDEFKQIERDRGLARRLQRVVLEEPSVDETVEILTGLRSRYEEHHRVTFTDAALRAAAKLARRHLRDSRLPDSAIDVLDEAGAGIAVAPDATANATAAGPAVGAGGVTAAADTAADARWRRQRRRTGRGTGYGTGRDASRGRGRGGRDRDADRDCGHGEGSCGTRSGGGRGGRGRAGRGVGRHGRRRRSGASGRGRRHRGRRCRGPSGRHRRPAPPRHRRRHRARHRAHGPHPREAGDGVGQGAAADPRRGPLPGGVRPGRRRRGGGDGHQARAGRARAARAPRRLLPVHRPHRRREDRAREAARHPPRERVHPL